LGRGQWFWLGNGGMRGGGYRDVVRIGRDVTVCGGLRGGSVGGPKGGGVRRVH